MRLLNNKLEFVHAIRQYTCIIYLYVRCFICIAMLDDAYKCQCISIVYILYKPNLTLQCKIAGSTINLSLLRNNISCMLFYIC